MEHFVFEGTVEEFYRAIDHNILLNCRIGRRSSIFFFGFLIVLCFIIVAIATNSYIQDRELAALVVGGVYGLVMVLLIGVAAYIRANDIRYAVKAVYTSYRTEPPRPDQMMLAVLRNDILTLYEDGKKVDAFPCDKLQGAMEDDFVFVLQWKDGSCALPKPALREGTLEEFRAYLRRRTRRRIKYRTFPEKWLKKLDRERDKVLEKQSSRRMRMEKLPEAGGEKGPPGPVKEERFVFQTTVRWLEEDSRWACWIYVTDEKRQATFWCVAIIALAMAGGAVFVVTLLDNLADVLLWGSVCLALVLFFFIVVGWRGSSWASQKKNFLQFAQMEPNIADGPVAVILTEQGCTLRYENAPEVQFPWENMCIIRTWSKGWDLLDRHDSYHVISLRRQNLTVGTPQALDAFLRQRARKAVKPRVIELDELKRIYKIEE